MKREACPICDGRAWRVVETASGSHAERCRCWHEAELGRRLERTGIPPGLQHCELASFEPQHHGQLAYALGKARELVQSWPLAGAAGLLLEGPAGTGKTHLAVGIVRELALGKGARPLFLDFRGLLKAIQNSWNPIAQASEKQVLDWVLDADLLALDDLGAEKPSAWVRETVAYVINERYVRGKPVVITTNLRCQPAEARPEQREAQREMARRLGAAADRPVDSLEERLGVPTLSRLYEMCLPVSLGEVPDYRRTIKRFGTDRFHLG